MGSRLTTVGKVVLVLALILGIFFIVLGVVNLANEDNYYNDDNSNNNGNNNSNNSNSENTFYAYTSNYVKNQSTDSYETYYIKFTPSSSGTYYFNIDNATLNNVTNSNGTVYYSSSSDYSFERSYSVYMMSGVEYTFKIYTDSTSIRYEFEY